MAKELTINNYLVPQILLAEKDYLVVFKPPLMHSAPLKNSNNETLLDWCCGEFPEVKNLTGRKEGEGGLLHRLDYETQGLILFARTKKGMESLMGQQKEGRIIKEYSALAAETKTTLPGFPIKNFPSQMNKFAVESAFRPYGVGRKAVRPVLEGEKQYKTEILLIKKLSLSIISLKLKIINGFRHQIRCHLAWMGTPVLNDSLYGGVSLGNGLFALRAVSLSFKDFATDKDLTYCIKALDNKDLAL